jgi:hypothetical protein
MIDHPSKTANGHRKGWDFNMKRIAYSMLRSLKRFDRILSASAGVHPLDPPFSCVSDVS